MRYSLNRFQVGLTIVFTVALAERAHAFGYNMGAFWRTSSVVTLSPVWIGSNLSYKTAFSTGDMPYDTGSNSGAAELNSPNQTTTDGTYLYAIEQCKISRWNFSTGVYQGWAGKINSSPTGGAAGCSGASSSTLSPGWCYGGTAYCDTVNGALSSAWGINSVGSYLYTVDNYKVNRFTNAGVAAGWVGKITSSPTSGSAGCSGAAVGTTTPGWCTSGAATTGSGEGQVSTGRNVANDGSYLYVVDYTNHRVLRYDIATGAESGWIGGFQRAKLVFETGTGIPVAGTADNMFTNTRGLATESSYLYVADHVNHRLTRHNLADGSFAGWVGRVTSTPTGGTAGCTSLTSGQITPGWCYGGSSAYNCTGDGSGCYPTKIVFNGTNMYVVDSYKINRYTTATGAFTGWIGKIDNTAATGGDPGCSGTSAAFTPGWCRGGGSTSGSGDGMMSSPTGLATDGTYFYVGDNSNGRVSKYAISSGAFIGWIGRAFSTAPTGGDPGCSGLASGSVTPGWCKGGTAQSGNTDGAFSSPAGLAIDNTYLYVADQNNHRIQRISLSTGTMNGWIGYISTAVTGGDPGCSGSASKFTPGWCRGGTMTASSNGNGAMNTPYVVHLAGTNLYVGDSAGKIMRYNVTTGAFGGWIGGISTTPTAGDAGCSGATGYTPGWCLGGSVATTTGVSTATFGGSVRGILADITNGFLYAADYSNHRVLKWDLNTAAFQGWIGREQDFKLSFLSVNTPTPINAQNDGYLNYPYGAGVLGSYLYVTQDRKITRFNLATNGTPSGWIGWVGTAPTGGDANCNGASNYTPGWCRGGTATQSSSAGGLYDTHGIAGLGSYLYSYDLTSNRIDRRIAATGAYAGWLGQVKTIPTGGDAGCTSAALGSRAPGWCIGGSAQSAMIDGTSYDANHVLPYGNSLYVSDTLNYRVQKISAIDGAAEGWVGRNRVAMTWSTGGDSPTTGRMDHSLYNPQHAIPYGTNLYVMDGGYRVMKYGLSDGVMRGWMGLAHSSWVASGGAAGCAGLTNAKTPGWCMGGQATSGASNDGFGGPRGGVMEGTNLYLIDSYRIVRVDVANGLITGWLGQISSPGPTGGDAGCSGSTNKYTPGWCIGGTPTTSTNGTGGMNSSEAIASDGTNFYVADYGNHRVARYTISTGAFTGWIGKMTGSPTAGDPGCNGATTGVATPGWCIGGTSSNGTGDGMLYGPTGISYKGSYLYVVEYSGARVSRFNAATGLFTGWIGRISATAATGGDAGCSGSASKYTPGWCTGGVAASASNTDGTMSNAVGLAMGTNYMWVTNSGYSRIDRYSISSGAYQGWIGKITTTSPTAGDSGCSGATQQAFTPGWCKGGTSGSGTTDGLLNNPRYLHYDGGTYLYVTDSSNGRIIRFGAAP